jgi:hypothetical protein
MAINWQDAIIYDEVTQTKHRVIERYMLPGKQTGSVLACEGRQLYWQWGNFVEWLSELPNSIHYEDRKSVVEFSVEMQRTLFEEAMEKYGVDDDWKFPDESFELWAKRAARRIEDDEQGECNGK